MFRGSNSVKRQQWAERLDRYGRSGRTVAEFCGAKQISIPSFDGSLFVLVNRRRDRLKILHFDGAGYWLHYRLLEAGTFEELKHRSGTRSLAIDTIKLSMLLSGVFLVSSRHRPKRYAKAEPTEAT